MRFTLLLAAVHLTTLTSCTKKTSGNPQNATYTVTINNGYGSGVYKAGDTVHVFSKEWGANQTFDAWRGDVNSLHFGNEWHEWFIMPERNIILNAVIKQAAFFSPFNTTIRGKNNMKQVYYYFPVDHKGIVYLLHGSGGSAGNWINFYEYQNFIKDLVTDGFGVVITEAEERTLNTDTNGDGSIRWSLSPADTINNVDYANIRIITDSLINRGLTTKATPRYSVGMSNGGAFSAALSMIYKFKAGVSYCAQSGDVIAQFTSTPFQYCMARNDNNDNVGQAGNTAAINNSGTIQARSICSKIFFNERAPLYPERFARNPGISITLSTKLFDEIKSKGYLDDKNYFKDFSSFLNADFITNPAVFPVLNSLSVAQKIFVSEQLNCTVTDHHFFSDLNKTTIKFLNSQCR
ncbi:MAG: hypothetical protein V4717_14155 [Bacteroidota bacterium]